MYTLCCSTYNRAISQGQVREIQLYLPSDHTLVGEEELYAQPFFFSINFGRSIYRRDFWVMSLESHYCVEYQYQKIFKNFVFFPRSHSGLKFCENFPDFGCFVHIFCKFALIDEFCKIKLKLLKIVGFTMKDRRVMLKRFVPLFD